MWRPHCPPPKKSTLTAGPSPFKRIYLLLGLCTCFFLSVFPILSTCLFFIVYPSNHSSCCWAGVAAILSNQLKVSQINQSYKDLHCYLTSRSPLHAHTSQSNQISSTNSSIPSCRWLRASSHSSSKSLPLLGLFRGFKVLGETTWW